MKKACTTNFPWVFRLYKTGISFKHTWDFKQGIKLIKERGGGSTVHLI